MVLPQSKRVWWSLGRPSSRWRGAWGAAQCPRIASRTRTDCCPEPPRTVTLVSSVTASVRASRLSRTVFPVLCQNSALLK